MTPWVESIMPPFPWDQSDRWRVAIGIGGRGCLFLGAGLWWAGSIHGTRLGNQREA